MEAIAAVKKDLHRGMHRTRNLRSVVRFLKVKKQ